MDNFLLFPPIFWKVVRWGSGSFEFYLLVCVISPCGAIQGMLLSNIRWKDLLDALLRLEWSRRNIKTSSPNRCSGIFLVESIEGWSKKQDKTSKQTSDHQTNQSGRSKQSLHESHGEARGERDVIRLRNPTEDKRAFRVLTFSLSLSLSKAGRREPWERGCAWKSQKILWGRVVMERKPPQRMC